MYVPLERVITNEFMELAPKVKLFDNEIVLLEKSLLESVIMCCTLIGFGSDVKPILIVFDELLSLNTCKISSSFPWDIKEEINKSVELPDCVFSILLKFFLLKLKNV